MFFFAEITDLVVTILVATTTFSPTRLEFTYHFWLSVSAEICSILIGIIQPLAMWSEEKKIREYYWKCSLLGTASITLLRRWLKKSEPHLKRELRMSKSKAREAFSKLFTTLYWSVSMQSLALLGIGQ